MHHNHRPRDERTVEETQQHSHSPPKRQKRITVADSLRAKNGVALGASGSERHQSRYNGEGNGNCSRRGTGQHANHQRKWGRGGIPDRWLQYPIAIGSPMGNSRFLAFKTPLRSTFFEGKEFKNRQEERFEVETVINHVNSLDKSLGLVIDLTNTDRYYDSKLWSNYEILYAKIRCPGHEVDGDERFYQRFREKIEQFIEQNGTDDKLIGVHCTHGLNRTGYLICRYMIEKHGWTAEMAIESFRISRGYPMERATYIESLKETEKRLSRMNVNESDNRVGQIARLGENDV